MAIAGNKGYLADRIDGYLMDLGIVPVVPSKANEDRGTRPVELDREAYRGRSMVERLIGWRKWNRRIFSIFEKTAKKFCGFVKVALILR